MFGLGFKFLDPGVLVDGELSLVAPAEKYLEDLVAAEGLSGAMDLGVVRQRTEEFLRSCPKGHQKADRLASTLGSKVPAYHFWMLVNQSHPRGREVPVKMAGGLGLRIGQNRELEFYSGHIGYHVYPPARGRHYAERAARMLFPLIRRHNLSPVYITCNPDNFASRRTIERLGGQLLDIVDIPPSHPFYERGERQKCRYLVPC